MSKTEAPDLKADDCVVETSYPGQRKRTLPAHPSVVEHYFRRDWDLPFVQPVGKFKAAVEYWRNARREHAEMLKRDGA